MSPTLLGTWYRGSCTKNCGEKCDYNTLLQFGGGSCTNKYDKLTDTSIQVLNTVFRVTVSNELSLLMLHVWYGGSCTNKHDKFMDTSIQVLSDTKISECSLPTYFPYLVGIIICITVNNKWTYLV